MLDYDYYEKVFKGKVSKTDFAELLPYITDFVEGYCESMISTFKRKESFVEYELDIRKAECYQLDFIYTKGGIAMLMGSIEANVKKITTSNFTIDTSEETTEQYDGVPLSPFAKKQVLSELRKKGYLNRCLYAN